MVHIEKCTLSSALSSFYFDDLQRVPPFISWLRYLSFNYHTYRLLLKVQYDPVPDILTTTAHMDNGVTEVAALVAMIIGYRVLAYLSLRWVKATSS
jgi:hypothetical protein